MTYLPQKLRGTPLYQAGPNQGNRKHSKYWKLNLMQEISYPADGGDEKPTVNGDAVQRLSTAGKLTLAGGTKRKSGSPSRS